jgi:hypothetical protein
MSFSERRLMPGPHKQQALFPDQGDLESAFSSLAADDPVADIGTALIPDAFAPAPALQPVGLADPASASIAGAQTPSPQAPAAPTPDLTFTWAGTTEAVQPADGKVAAGQMQPPDCSLAAGPNCIITTVNDQIDIYNKTGTLLSGESLNQLFNVPSSTFLFDPRVTFDQFYGRFIVIADDQTGSNSVVHVAVSKDSNPLDGWWIYAFNVKLGNSWLDQPNPGVDGSSFYFSGNYYDLSSSGNMPSMPSQEWALDMNALSTGGTVTPYVYSVADIGAPSSDTFQYAPAHMYGSQPGFTGTFLVSYEQSNSGSDTLNIIEFSNAAQGTANWNSFSINVGNISDEDTQDARQQGTTDTLDVGDSRIEWAIWRNDKLYAVNEIRIGSGADARDVVHWFVVDTTNLNNLKLLSQGNIDYGSGVDTYYGNLTVDSAGNIIIGYSYSGSTSFAGSVYGVIPAGASGLQDGGVSLAEGQGTYSGNRWGDFSGVALDPSDNGSFWVFNQYATNTDSWATTIGGYHVPSLYALPVTADDLMTLQQGIQGSTNPTEANSAAAAIDAVPATQTVAGYANQLLSNSLPLSQVAMSVDALMFGGVDNVAEFDKLATGFLPPQLFNAAKFGFDTTVYDAQALGLALAGGNGSSNAFATNYGSLSASAFAQAAGAATGVSTGAIQNFASNWIQFYTAHPAATFGLSVTLASYGAAFGDAVGVALLNATAAHLQSLVPNALIDNAEGLLLVGSPLASQPTAHALQGSSGLGSALAPDAQVQLAGVLPDTLVPAYGL